MSDTTPTMWKYRAYPEYRASDIELLGEIPKHWRTIRFKFVLWLQRGHDLPVSEIVAGEYPVCGSNGCIGYHNSFTTKGPGVTVGRSGSVGEVNYVEKDYWAHNTALYVKEFRGSIPKYAFYLLTTLDVKYLSEGTAVGTLNRNYIHDLYVAVPRIDEQRAIAAFLDRETARIDALIAKKQRQIELLQEKRAALISHAVTKGLDPNVKMRHSGIEWLGRIPEHWSIKRLKFVSTLQTGLTLGKKYDGDNLVTRPYLRVANVQDGYLDLSTITEVELPPSDVSRYELCSGDVLMTEGGDFDKLGRGYVWEDQIPGCLHQNHIFAVRPDQNELRSAFLAAMLTSSHGKNYFTSTSQQTTNLATTNSTKLLSFPVPLPPLDEQDAILERIRDAANHLESLVRKVGSSIERLSEYRTALISAAVTGRIDVRQVDL